MIAAAGDEKSPADLTDEADSPAYVMGWLPRGSSSGRIESNFVIDFQRYADRREREEKRRARRLRTVELLDLSDEFARMLRSGEVNRRADLAAIYGMSRARVTQLLYLQELHPEICGFIRHSARESWGGFISERSLRPMTKMAPEQQLGVARELWPGFKSTELTATRWSRTLA